MKKARNLAFVMMLSVISIFTMTSVKAAGWKSSLDLPYGTIYTGAAVRPYATGAHRINISVDGFNKSNGSVRRSGTTTMAVGLWDVATGRELSQNKATYTYGSCAERSMGSYSAGSRSYSFLSSIYNSSTGGRDNYDGVKSNAVYMYPAAP